MSRTPFDEGSTNFGAASTVPRSVDGASEVADGNKSARGTSQGRREGNQTSSNERKAEQGIVAPVKPNQRPKKCTRCVELEIECSFNYSVKKRGPPTFANSDVVDPRLLLDSTPSGSLHQSLGDPSPRDFGGSPQQPLPLAQTVPQTLNSNTKSLAADILNSAPSPLQPTSRHWSSLSRHRFTLEQFLDRETVQRLLYLYIDYLWHLTPCFHIPSFLEDFSRGRDAYDKDFLAVVMALSTFTLIGIPKGWLPFDKSELYDKAWDCIQETQAILFTLQNYPPTLSTMVAHCLICFVFANLDRTGPAMMHLGMVHKSSHYLRLFDPHTYLALNPIDAEVAKRLYWLIHGGDKTTAALAFIMSLDYSAITLGHLDDLLHRNQVEMLDCVPELQLRASANADSTMSDLSRLLGFYDHKTARHNAFMVAQANIYCTQALIRRNLARLQILHLPLPELFDQDIGHQAHA
ncbi:hypothetical protein QFC20_002919 [Naganishia adeliensis]|uniref:Uncharacterized protein n=1 Tax=Naganishia adeliensis TaxID=92952 RepID=A0ACC2WFQ1_9TREE|nr:hypothetical protein QFC20_002919 [Naganishia adeliensis]